MTGVDTEAKKSRSIRKRLIFGLVALVILVLVAQELRQHFHIEWSAESIQTTVDRAGWLAPAGFMLLTIFRQLLALPSVMILTSAGLLFGTVLGTLIGGIGIGLNALLLFSLARYMGRDWILPKLRDRYPDFEERTHRVGPFVVAVMTAHPMGVLTPTYLAAGVTRMRPLIFIAADFPAALFRAACYAFLGANLLNPESPRFWIAMTVLAIVSILPLAHPGFRRRLFNRRSS